MILVAISWFLELSLSNSSGCKYVGHKSYFIIFNSKLEINVVCVVNISNALHS